MEKEKGFVELGFEPVRPGLHKILDELEAGRNPVKDFQANLLNTSRKNMNMKVTRITRAQFRMLGRSIKGERLPEHRFRSSIVTVATLHRKGCWHVVHGHWEATEHGRKVHAAKGIYRPSRATS